jgi:hypothetical protein
MLSGLIRHSRFIRLILSIFINSVTPTLAKKQQNQRKSMKKASQTAYPESCLQPNSFTFPALPDALCRV